jgi:S-adenosylmethionine synthetase
MELTVTALGQSRVADLPVEIVERKGLGHPDSICDALAENLSVALSRFYLERFGYILHHNVDKALLWGGAAHPQFGGGKVTEPLEIYLAGRATKAFRGVSVPLEEIAVEASRRWLTENIRHLDPERHVRLHCLIRPSSTELVSLFMRQQESGVPLANDTSCGVGFAPLDTLENLVRQTERLLNAAGTKAQNPEIGEDVKVMGVRQGNRIRLTVACALVDRYIADMGNYLAKKARIEQLTQGASYALSQGPLEVSVNTADGTTPDSVYLTVTGTSAEGGDDGQVGRGNRVNGLITPYRPMSTEAAAGKNPVSHVGKLYNILAHRLACAITVQVAEVSEAYCYLSSQIGRPIDDPQVFDVQVRLEDSGALEDVRGRIQDIVRQHLASVNTLWRELIGGAATLY